MDLNLNKSIIADDYVFFSYSHSNKEQVYEIKKIIEEKGYSVVLDTKMSSGDLWTQRAKEFIRNSHCKAVLFFISDSSVVSAPVLRELEFTNRYDRPYCAVLLDDETVDEKFERINDSNTSEELKDIVDNMRDYFPDEKLYILNDKSLVTKVCEFLNNNGLRANDNQKIENINSENISPKAEIDKRVSDNRERYVVIEGDEITPEDIQSALNLERKFLDVDDDEQFGLEKCLVWFKKNKWIYTFLKDTQTGEVIANIDAEPVTKSCYKEILSGKYPDIEINDEDIESFDMPGFYYMYFASIFIIL